MFVKMLILSTKFLLSEAFSSIRPLEGTVGFFFFFFPLWLCSWFRQQPSRPFKGVFRNLAFYRNYQREIYFIQHWWPKKYATLEYTVICGAFYPISSRNFSINRIWGEISWVKRRLVSCRTPLTMCQIKKVLCMFVKISIPNIAHCPLLFQIHWREKRNMLSSQVEIVVLDGTLLKG